MLKIILMCRLHFQGATPRNVIAQGEVKRSPEPRDSYLTQALKGRYPHTQRFVSPTNNVRQNQCYIR